MAEAKKLNVSQEDKSAFNKICKAEFWVPFDNDGELDTGMVFESYEEVLEAVKDGDGWDDYSDYYFMKVNKNSGTMEVFKVVKQSVALVPVENPF